MVLFILYVSAGHNKKHMLDDDEPLDESRKIIPWDKDNGMMNNVDHSIAITITFHMTTKEMWTLLWETFP